MMRAPILTAALLAVAAAASAQTAAPKPAPRFGIEDNSFLVEEAFNQDKGVVQNIFLMTRNRAGEWAGSFTQEWPVGGQRHQLSATIPFSRVNGTTDVGDIFINSRLQVWEGGGVKPAFSPRLSWSRSAWQVGLPFSKEFDRIYVHANAGNTWSDDGAAPSVAGSVIVAARPMFNLMIEVTNEWRPDASGHQRVTTLSPGVRGGWNVGDSQIVVGIGAPITRGAVRDRAVLLYFSYELPFTKNR